MKVCLGKRSKECVCTKYGSVQIYLAFGAEWRILRNEPRYDKLCMAAVLKAPSVHSQVGISQRSPDVGGSSATVAGQGRDGSAWFFVGVSRASDVKGQIGGRKSESEWDGIRKSIWLGERAHAAKRSLLCRKTCFFHAKNKW